MLRLYGTDAALRPQALDRRHRQDTGSRRALRPGRFNRFLRFTCASDPHWRRLTTSDRRQSSRGLRVDRSPDQMTAPSNSRRSAGRQPSSQLVDFRPDESAYQRRHEQRITSNGWRIPYMAKLDTAETACATTRQDFMLHARQIVRACAGGRLAQGRYACARAKSLPGSDRVIRHPIPVGTG